MGNYTGSLDVLFWSPEEYSQLAQDLTALGQKYEECVNAAAQAINSLGESGAWTGYLFNELIEKYNESITTLNEDAEMLTTEIPTAISRQAQDQASANHGSVAPISLASLQGILNPSTTADDGTGSVYIDPTAVEQGINLFVENLNAANQNAQNYKDLFSETIAKGWDVSADIKSMEGKIDNVCDRVYQFNERFRDLLQQCATDSAMTMAAALESSTEATQNIE